MGAILDDLEMRAGIGDEVGNDVCDEQFIGWPKVGREEVSHCDDGAARWHVGDHLDGECLAEFEPCLVEPALGGGGFSGGEQLGGIS